MRLDDICLDIVRRAAFAVRRVTVACADAWAWLRRREIPWTPLSPLAATSVPVAPSADPIEAVRDLLRSMLKNAEACGHDYQTFTLKPGVTLSLRIDVEKG